MADRDEQQHRRFAWAGPRRPAPRGQDGDGTRPGGGSGSGSGSGSGDGGGTTGGRPAGGDGGRDGDGEGPRRSPRRALVRWLTAGLSVGVLLTAAAGAFEYFRLDGNLRDLPLFGGIAGDAGHERPDAFGRIPVNVLVIGSDTRAGSADCRLGGDCGPGQNADVDMVLHLSADRSHATVLSIPRDTVTDLPACRRPRGGVAPARRGPVNGTLQFGPGCTVAAVHTLTGVPIDHFVLADFAGVVRLSDAVGGVPVCVDRDVYDPYSHLKLARGSHALKGEAALQFLRSRHSFGDGSDLGRTTAQHLFLAALARRLRDSGSLTDPAAMLDLADAATKALTVDPGLASVSRLAGLGEDVRKVPSARFGFTTMPSIPDPGDHNRLVPGPGADRVFSMLAADVPPHAVGPGRADGRAGQGPGSPAATAGPGPDEAFEAPARIATPPAAEVRTAAGAACAKVATGRVVTVRGVAMSPSAAYAATPRIPVSAP